MNDEYYMCMALEEARRAETLGEVPIGAVVVYQPIDPATRKALAEPRVIARACNVRETQRDPAGHAEFVALRQASEFLGAWRLTGCTVYVTLEPCIMCAGLMHQSRIDRCVFGASDPKAGALGTLYAVNEDSRLNHQFETRAGVLGDECSDMLRAFFSRKRKKKQPLEDVSLSRDSAASFPVPIMPSNDPAGFRSTLSLPMSNDFSSKPAKPQPMSSIERTELP